MSARAAAALLVLALASAAAAQDRDDGLPPVRSSLDGPWDDEDALELVLPVERLEDGTVVISGPAGSHHLPAQRWALERCAAALKGDDAAERRRGVFEAALLGDEAAALVTGLVARLQDAEEEGDVRLVALQVLARLGPLAHDATPALLAAVPDLELGTDASLALARVVTPGSVPALAEGLRGDDPAVRAAAASALARLARGRLEAADAAALVAPLAAAVDDEGEDPSVRRLAAWSLGRLGEPAHPALPALVGALRDDEVADEAMVALVRLHGPDTIEALMRVLGEPASEPAARRHCAQLLAVFGQTSPVAQAALTRALGDPAPEVRVEVLRASDRLGLWSQILPRLAALVGDEDEEVVYTAANLAGQHGPPWPDGVLPALVAAFDRWPVDGVRRVILIALARCGPAAAESSLSVFRRAVVEGGGAAEEGLRGLATLGRGAAPALEEVLAHLEGGAHDPRSPAWEALVAIAPGACPGVVRLLEHEDRRVRARAAEVLAAGGAESAGAGEALAAALARERYPEVRAALEALRRGLEAGSPAAEVLTAVRGALAGPGRPPAPLSPLGEGPARASAPLRLDGPRCFELRLDARSPITEGLVLDWPGLQAALRAALREPDSPRQLLAMERAWVNQLAPALRSRADLCRAALRRLLEADTAALATVLGEAPQLGDVVLARGPDTAGDDRDVVLILGERLDAQGQAVPRLIAPEGHQAVGEVWLPSYLCFPTIVPRLDHYPDYVGWIAVDTAWALERVAPDGQLVLDAHQGLHLQLDDEDLARLRAGGVRLYVHAGGWGAHCVRRADEVDRSGPLPAPR